MPSGQQSPSEADRPAASCFRTTWFGGAIVVAAVVAAYAGALGGPFIFDDVPSVVLNPSLHTLRSAFLPPPESTVYGRPIANATFALNWAVSGDRVWSYHVLNVGIHIGAALLLFGIVRRTLLRDPLRARFGAHAIPLACIAALLWALHPLQTESVTYVSQRVESLAGLFCLLTLYAFIRGVDARPAGARGWLAVSACACALGMATKETAVAAPLLVLLYDVAFARRAWGAAVKERKAYYAALGAAWILLIALVAGTQGRNGTAGFGTAMSPGSYLLTQCQAIVHYLGLVVWPAPLVLDYGFRTVRGLGEVWPQALLLAGLAGATVAALLRRPALGFLGAWFFCALAPSSSIVPVATQTMAEHRMYLALAAPVVAAVLGLGLLLGRRAIWAGALLAVVLAGLTIQRNRDYRSQLAIWRDTTEKRPENPRGWGNLGGAFIDAGLWREALAAGEREAAIDWRPKGDAHLIIGRALTGLGRPLEAVPHFQKALGRSPDDFNGHNSFGMALAALGRWPGAVVEYETALRLRPDFAEGRNNLANALGKVGRIPEALAQYEAAIRLEPASPDAESNWARTLAESGRLAEALPHFERALALRPDAAAHEDLAAALAAAGRLPDAIAHDEQALRIEPGRASARYGLGNLLARSGRLDEAVAQYEAAIRSEPGLAQAHHNLAIALVQLGRLADALRQFEETLRLMPESAATHHEMAVLLGQLGRRDDAVRSDEAALRLQPDFPDAREHLAWLRQQQPGH